MEHTVLRVGHTAQNAASVSSTAQGTTRQLPALVLHPPKPQNADTHRGTAGPSRWDLSTAVGCELFAAVLVLCE